MKEEVKKLLKVYASYCKLRYRQHYEASRYNKSKYKKLVIPILVLSSLLTVLSSYNASFTNIKITWIIAVVSFFLTFCQALSSFYEYNEVSNRHAITYSSYHALYRTIEMYLIIIGKINIHHEPGPQLEVIDIHDDSPLYSSRNLNEYTSYVLENHATLSDENSKINLVEIITDIFNQLKTIETSEPLLPIHIKKQELF